MNFSIEKLLHKINIKTIIVLILVLFFASYMIPMLYAYFSSDLFIYVNAWDEETYMSYQGALGALNKPGYFLASFVTLFFQKIGISGSMQNLIFDLILIPLMAMLLYKILLKFKIGHFYASVFTIIILFSSVLFNYANPLLIDNFPIRHIRFIMFGYESYATILRTPNPQLSYLLAIVAIYIFQKKHKHVILFLPLPFLYFYVAVPYFYFLIIYLYFKFFNKKMNIKHVFTSSLFAYLLISFGMILMDKLFLQNSTISTMSKEFYFKTHEIFIPLITIVSMLFLMLQYALYKKNKKHILLMLIYLQTYLFLALLLIANLQIICGYLLSYKNYYDYSFSILVGISISIFIYSIVQAFSNRVLVYITILLFILPMLYLNFTSQGFNFEKKQFKIYMGGTLPKNNLEKIIKDPTHALITSLDLRSKVAYALPHITIPPLSYQYRFTFIERQCSYYQHLFNNAMYYLKNNHPESLKYFTGEYKEYNKFKTLYRDKKQNTSSNCNKPLYFNTDFFLIPVDNQHIWHYFP